MGLWTSYFRNIGSFKRICKSKKARYMGCSAILLYHLLKANMISRQNNFDEFVSIRNYYNMKKQLDFTIIIQPVKVLEIKKKNNCCSNCSHVIGCIKISYLEELYQSF